MEIQNNPTKPEKSLSYMLFVLGIVALAAGAYLCTITTVVWENQTYTMWGATVTAPTPKQVYPYSGVGAFVIFGGLGLIGWALYSVTRRAPQPNIPISPKV